MVGSVRNVCDYCRLRRKSVVPIAIIRLGDLSERAIGRNYHTQFQAPSLGSDKLSLYKVEVLLRRFRWHGIRSRRWTIVILLLLTLLLFLLVLAFVWSHSVICTNIMWLKTLKKRVGIGSTRGSTVWYVRQRRGCR